jgi:hypothetical protein
MDRSSADMAPEALGRNGPMYDCLTIRSPVVKEVNGSHCQFKIWLDPDAAYRLCGVECALGQIDGRAGEVRYVVSWRAVWNGSNCDIHHYEQLQVPNESPAMADWRTEAFETMIDSYSLEQPSPALLRDANIEIGVFDVTPVTGTNVIDEIEGVRYVIGNAEQILEKSALDYAQSEEFGDSATSRPPPGPQRTSSRMAVILLNVAVIGIVCASLAWRWWRRHE